MDFSSSYGWHYVGVSGDCDGPIARASWLQKHGLAGQYMLHSIHDVHGRLSGDMLHDEITRRTISSALGCSSVGLEAG